MRVTSTREPSLKDGGPRVNGFSRLTYEARHNTRKRVVARERRIREYHRSSTCHKDVVMADTMNLGDFVVLKQRCKGT